MSVGGVVKSIQDIMRKDVGVDGDAQRISQLVWLIFMKIFDDREQEAELTNDKYKPAIPKRLLWRNWASDKEGITGEELIEFINNDLFKNLKNLDIDIKKNPKGYIVKGVFEDAYNYMKSGHLLRQVINKINGINFNNSEDRHLFGDLYEKILKDLQSAGNAGEYYTPRGVTQFIVDIIDPKLGEKLLDPACGTGGFLSCAIESVRSKYVKTISDRAKFQNMFLGVEKKPLPHLLCITNMILHGIETPINLRRDNTLSRPLRDYGAKDRVDIIITNPPFGGQEEDGIEGNFPAALRTKETADLFILLIMKLLKKNGRAGVVLPDGFLFGEGVKSRIKEELLSQCNLHTIVRLPKGVFNPYTGIATNILFFDKGVSTSDVWFYEHPLPSGKKTYNKTNPIKVEEFQPIKDWWNNRIETNNSWKVTADYLSSRNYNLAVANPNTKLIISEHTPFELLGKIKSIYSEIEKELGIIEKSLMDIK